MAYFLCDFCIGNVFILVLFCLAAGLVGNLGARMGRGTRKNLFPFGADLNRSDNYFFTIAKLSLILTDFPGE